MADTGASIMADQDQWLLRIVIQKARECRDNGSGLVELGVGNGKWRGATISRNLMELYG